MRDAEISQNYVNTLDFINICIQKHYYLNKAYIQIDANKKRKNKL